MDFLISLIAGLFALAVVMYALFKAFKKQNKLEWFIEERLKMLWLVPHVWWMIMVFMLFGVVGIINTVFRVFNECNPHNFVVYHRCDNTDDLRKLEQEKLKENVL